jgi:broad specificity phosphatase PhoE
MRIWLVRHAETAWTGERYCGRSDPPLSPEGERHAEELARSLEHDIAGAAVWSSPARRARDTAALLGRPVRPDERLREIDFGALEGLTFERLAAAYPTLARSILSGETRFDPPGGERYADLEERAGAVWSDLRIAGGDVVVVSHGGTLRALAHRVVGHEVGLGPCEWVAAEIAT